MFRRLVNDTVRVRPPTIWVGNHKSNANKRDHSIRKSAEVSFLFNANEGEINFSGSLIKAKTDRPVRARPTGLPVCLPANRSLVCPAAARCLPTLSLARHQPFSPTCRPPANADSLLLGRSPVSSLPSRGAIRNGLYLGSVRRSRRAAHHLHLRDHVRQGEEAKEGRTRRKPDYLVKE